jgi:hypothetical protein
VPPLGLAGRVAPPDLDQQNREDDQQAQSQNEGDRRGQLQRLG